MNQSAEFMSYEDQIAATRARRLRLGLDRPTPVVMRPQPPVVAPASDGAQPYRRSDPPAAHRAMIADIGKGRFDRREWRGDQPTEVVAAYKVIVGPRDVGESPLYHARRLCEMNGTTLDRLRLKDNHAMSVHVRWGIAAGMWAEKRDSDLSLVAMGRILSRDHTTVLNALRKLGVYASRV